MEREQDARERAIALLESQHDFPGPFEFRIVIHPGSRSAVLGAVLSVAGGSAALVDVSERSSAQGRYVALRVRVTMAEAETVLDVYEVLRGVSGVLTVM